MTFATELRDAGRQIAVRWIMEGEMALRAALALLVLCSQPLLPAIGVAIAADNNDPKTVQTECARAWNACWDGCKGKANSCYKGCNDKYDICLNIEMEMQAPPTNTPDAGGTNPKPKGSRGTFGVQTLPGMSVKP